MSKQASQRIHLLITTIFIATISFGLFYSYNRIASPLQNPGTSGPQSQIQDTTGRKKTDPQDKALQAEKTKRAEESKKAVASGDAYFAAKDYLNAKAAYQLAIDQNPDDQVAKDKLRKTMDLLRSQKAQNILFDVAVASADKLFQAGDYEKAKIEYENAAKMLPGDPYPRNKINEIIKLRVDKQVKDEEYARAIASADQAFAVKNLPMALLDYKKAVTIKPEEKHPQTRIKEITDLLAAQKVKDDAYKKAIALGDQQLKEIRYPDAIKSYKDALAVKPEQVYPKNKIMEIEGLMGRIKKAQEDYDNFIALADSFYIDKKYFKARENYLMASSVKPSESYPREMVSKADKMLTGQEAAMAKALEEQYANTISGADKLLNDKSYEPARAEYVKASNLKPGEPYPKEKIQSIDATLASALKNKDEQYKMAIEAGDKALSNKVYDIAKNEFQAALEIKPAETYPKTKLAEIEKLIALDAKKKAEDTKYTNAIARGDSLFFEKVYLPARLEFQAALKMKPAEAYPRDRIADIDAVLANLDKLKAKETQYAALLAKADKGFMDKIYAISKDDYAKASALKPNESYPKERMAEIDRIQGDLAAIKALDEKYKNTIASADNLLASKSYDQAKAEYQNAGVLKPTETYPPAKIAEIDKALAAIASQRSADENYQASIKAADQLLADRSWDPAKAEYQKALVIKPAEQYPRGKIAEIDATLVGLAKQKALEDEYIAAIGQGDKLLADKAWAEAKTQYQNAQRLKPAETYPKEKISEIDKLLGDLAQMKAKDDQYAATILKADNLLAQKNYAGAKSDYANASAIKPAETYPKEKIAEIERILGDLASAKALDDSYKAAVSKGDQLFAAKTWEDARVEYENALKLKPGEQYPATKIAEIEKVLADLAAKKSLDENYQATITRADQLLASSSYDQAKSEYGKALGLKPNEQYPKSKIAEIDGILAEIARKKALDDEYGTAITLADKLLGEKSYAESKTKFQAALKLKPGEAYPSEKIAEIDKALAELARLKSIDDQYAAAILKADNLFAQKTYATAKTEYANASAIKPNEAYPKDKIIEIDRLMAEIAAARALDDSYLASITRADKLLMAKTYGQAKTEYQDAQKLKPAEAYPSAKIAEIDKILADLEAEKILNENYQATMTKANQLLLAKTYTDARAEYEKARLLKPVEQVPVTKIAEIDAILAALAKQKALDEEYAATIREADVLLADKSYEPAKAKYQQATALKPSEQYPKTKLGEIDKALSDVARLKAIDDQFNAAVAEADKLLQSKTYDQAREAYGRAGKIKPSEQYPKDKITEIDGLLTAIAKQKAVDDQYRASVAKADQLLASKSLDQAKTEYNTALTLKPAEQYPKDKIAEIDVALAEMRAKEEAYKTSIAAADQLLAQKKYDESRVEYQNSLSIKPQATYPKEKIAEINKALEELLGKQKFYENLIVDADQLFREKDYPKAKDTYQRASGVLPDQAYPKNQITMITARLDSLYRANKSAYDKAIADGDKSYNSFEFDKAVDAYSEAANLLPMEAYPRDMIVKIRRTIAENAIADVLKNAVTITSNNEKQFSFTPVNIASRKNNFVYIKIKNLSGKTFNVLMRYGKDKQSNGGIVMRNITIDGKVNERLVSVRDQDLWSREDNNWISIIPQGGDVEVSFIQVSRARLD